PHPQRPARPGHRLAREGAARPRVRAAGGPARADAPAASRRQRPVAGRARARDLHEEGGEVTTAVEVDKAEAFRRFMSTMRHEGFDDALRYYARSTRLTEAFPEVMGPIDSYLTARRN